MSGPALPIPPVLEETVGALPGGRTWLAALPARVGAIAERWGLVLGPPFAANVTCSWVAPCTTSAGGGAVLKVAFPHDEARDEAAGLRLWDGEATVRLLDAEPAEHALLLERCEPGDPLTGRPEPEQDEVVASLLRRLWRPPPEPSPFRPLATLAEQWRTQILAAPEGRPDPVLVREGADALVELAARPCDPVVLATDLHAGNVLRARREPWLAIDPKPYVGDRAYDGTQHLLNCTERMAARPRETVARLGALLGVDEARLRAWAFARFATQRSDAPATSGRIASALAD